MNNSSFFRAVARQALSGKWGDAVLAGIIASVLGAVDGFSVNINLNSSNSNNFASDFSGEIFSPEWFNAALLPRSISPSLLYAIISASLISLALTLIIGSIVAVGYASYNLKLIDGKFVSIGDLFSFFSHFKNIVLTALLKLVKTLFWTLLFIIPGIIASYNYALTDYLLAENPELSPNDALEKSKSLMYGNRFRLFCLQLSFLGWGILCVFTFGIGFLWLNPYMYASISAFYRDICQNNAEQMEV